MKEQAPAKAKKEQDTVEDPGKLPVPASKGPGPQTPASKSSALHLPPPARAESAIDQSMSKESNLSGFVNMLPTVGSQSQAIPQIAQSTSGNAALPQPLLSHSPNAVGARSMVFDAGREPASEKQAPRLSAHSDSQSMLSVPLPSVSMASTQTLSAEANTMVNFQLQFEIQRINDSLRNIGQILEKSQILAGGSQNSMSMMSLPP